MKTSWNKGKTKQFFPQLGNAGPKKGNTPWNKGKYGYKIHTEKSKEAIRSKKIGVVPYKMTKEIKEKMSKSKKGVKWNMNQKNAYKPEKHPMWKGGRIPFLRKLVLKRDGFACSNCKENNLDVLCVDHKIPKIIRKDLKFNIDNLITLCANCHMIKTKEEFRNKLYGKLKRNK